eukprot:366238-Chlamydomonas_euryale.AAC.17
MSPPRPAICCVACPYGYAWDMRVGGGRGMNWSRVGGDGLGCRVGGGRGMNWNWEQALNSSLRQQARGDGPGAQKGSSDMEVTCDGYVVPFSLVARAHGRLCSFEGGRQLPTAWHSGVAGVQCQRRTFYVVTASAISLMVTRC